MIFEVRTKYLIVKAKYIVMYDEIIFVAFCIYLYVFNWRSYEVDLEKPKPSWDKLFLWLFIVGKKVVSYTKVK